MIKSHENYLNLIWTLAKTDFTLRYHGSMLGYLWAILKPLLLFLILNFVFSSIFNPRSQGNEFYALQLLLGIVMFTFFSEGTISGTTSLLAKAQLVTKIFVPRWTIIVASTLNSLMVFVMNLIVVVVFFAYKHVVPSVAALAIFVLSCVLTYLLLLAFSLVAAPLYVRYRDVLMIWEVILNALFYATPIIYHLQMMPEYIQRILLVNPMAFIIHFNKEAIFKAHFLDLWQGLLFVVVIFVVFCMGILGYRTFSKSIAENL